MFHYSTLLFSVENDPLPFNLSDEVLSLIHSLKWNSAQTSLHPLWDSMTHQEQLPPNRVSIMQDLDYTLLPSQKNRGSLCLQWLSVTLQASSLLNPKDLQWMSSNTLILKEILNHCLTFEKVSLRKVLFIYTHWSLIKEGIWIFAVSKTNDKTLTVQLKIYTFPVFQKWLIPENIINTIRSTMLKW